MFLCKNSRARLRASPFYSIITFLLRTNAYRSHHGRYLSAHRNGSLTANAVRYSTSETFEVGPQFADVDNLETFDKGPEFADMSDVGAFFK